MTDWIENAFEASLEPTIDGKGMFQKGGPGSGNFGHGGRPGRRGGSSGGGGGTGKLGSTVTLANGAKGKLVAVGGRMTADAPGATLELTNISSGDTTMNRMDANRKKHGVATAGDIVDGHLVTYHAGAKGSKASGQFYAEERPLKGSAPKRLVEIKRADVPKWIDMAEASKHL